MMDTNILPIFIGDTPQRQHGSTTHGEYVTMLGEAYYQIENFNAIEPFFMSVASSADHWLFIASTGGLSAGRSSAENALFPYYTDDKLIENHENTGSKSIFLIKRFDRTCLWEPFSDRQQGIYQVKRSIYKNITSTAIVFEEKNLDLGLTFRYAWRTSDRFGFVKTSWLINDASAACRVEILDGIQNILPANVEKATQNVFSSLLDAYKRSELRPSLQLAIFTLNSILSDLAEPSESLLATVVYSLGLEKPDCLLSSLQLNQFRTGQSIHPEPEVRGRRGAFFVHKALDLVPSSEHTWYIIADVRQDSAAIIQKEHWLRGNDAGLINEIERDIAANRDYLWKLVAGSDGLEMSRQKLLAAHHFSSTMFNLMRGGSFPNQYWVDKADFSDYVAAHNRPLLAEHAAFFAALPQRTQIMDLIEKAESSGQAGLIRLARAYLPLTFSRRHGDPSRPWNQFVINIKKPDGALKVDFEGNWRDIFQNWEALAYSFPEYIEGMICNFLNATTLDGYNPYRITFSGVDWEVPEPGNPWANIGYWGDHQVIYLQKLMEISAEIHPGLLGKFLNRPLFSYANVPYRIKAYAELLQDPYSTIQFDWDQHHQIERRVKEIGTDAKLVMDADGNSVLATLAEKLLSLLLTKMANFVPEGGIWMNTQRPEWNDANNALVGKGLSVVTVCYLRRTLAFCSRLFANFALDTVSVHQEISQFFSEIFTALAKQEALLSGSFTPAMRRMLLDQLGGAGSDFRWGIYTLGLSGQQVELPVAEIRAFLNLAQRYCEHTLRANRRPDALYHSYNILHLHPGRAVISPLYEMLEGQAAILSSGMLTAAESVTLLKALRQSSLFVTEQHSYLLYPERTVPAFLEKNQVAPERVNQVPLLQKLISNNDSSILIRDLEGSFHFSSRFRNFKQVSHALNQLAGNPLYAELVKSDSDLVRDLFEEVFRHSEFTGRSGTFFAYEGLGSIYWHMVAKLLLAVSETLLRVKNEPSAAALLDCYADIRQGLSFNKSPQEYGAFPSDPYSHTPKGQGAKQPGMTGLVKEELLTRQVELGYTVVQGCLVFEPLLFDKTDLLAAPGEFTYLDVRDTVQSLTLPADSMAYTICQVPVIVTHSDYPSIKVHFANSSTTLLPGSEMDLVNSQHIFNRDGVIHHLAVAMVMRK